MSTHTLKMHWKRQILATSVCIIGGGVLIFALGVLYVLVIQPGFERPSDIPFPVWSRSVFTFIYVFCAVHFSSYILPPGSRHRGALFSGFALLLVFYGIILLFVPLSRVSTMLVPVLLDSVPIIGAVILSSLLHARKCA